MSGDHLGELSPSDPIHSLLGREVFNGNQAPNVQDPVFDVFSLDANGIIFRYGERRSGLSVVGKFYGRKWLDGSQSGQTARRAQLMHRELENLRFACTLELDGSRHRVVRPLAESESINCVLVEDYAPGPDLETFVREVLAGQDARQLFGCLDDIAWFLADLHSRTSFGHPLPQEPALAYLGCVADELLFWRVACQERYGSLRLLVDHWASSGILATGDEVLVHGDATPTNFLWRADHDLAVIDLERLHPGDRAQDLGCVAAELKHLFWWHGQDPEGGEAFIRHLYRTYADCVLIDTEQFHELTQRGRFFMGCNMLRIARNPWLQLGYRRQLLEEATRCLKI